MKGEAFKEKRREEERFVGREVLRIGGENDITD
jgi:hypothetical protein